MALKNANITYSPKLPDAKQDHFSNLLLTLNTNWRPKTKEEARAQAQQLYAALRVFLTPRFLAPCVKLRGNTRVKALKISQWGVELVRFFIFYFYAFHKIQFALARIQDTRECFGSQNTCGYRDPKRNQPQAQNIKCRQRMNHSDK